MIVDDHTFFAAGLRMLLDNEADLVVCDVADRASNLDQRVSDLRPDLIVIDLTLDAGCGLELGRRLREARGATIPILFTSSFSQPSRAQLALIRPCAFVDKAGRPEEFLSALRHVLDGVRAAHPSTV